MFKYFQASAIERAHGCAFASGNEKAGPHGFSPTYILARILHLEDPHDFDPGCRTHPSSLRTSFEESLSELSPNHHHHHHRYHQSTLHFLHLASDLRPLPTVRIPRRHATIMPNGACQRGSGDHSLLGSGIRTYTKSLSYNSLLVGLTGLDFGGPKDQNRPARLPSVKRYTVGVLSIELVLHARRLPGR